MFNHKAEKFSLDNAKVLVKASQSAYEPLSKMQDSIKKYLPIDRFLSFDEKQTQCFLAGTKDYIVLSFRGTETVNVRDWLTGIKIRKVKTKMGRVHRGFLGGWLSVKNKVLNTLSSMQDNAQSLWITGHSMGAALATLATAEFLNKDKPVAGLYTYGSTRVGDKQFARNFSEFKDYTFRFVNNGDFVTRLPPRLLGYSHVGQVAHVSCNEVSFSKMFWDQFLDAFQDRFKHLDDFDDAIKSGILDHPIDSYVTALKHCK